MKKPAGQLRKFVLLQKEPSPDGPGKGQCLAPQAQPGTAGEGAWRPRSAFRFFRFVAAGVKDTLRDKS